MNRSTFAYRHVEPPDEGALRLRILDLAAVRVRYGYRYLTVLLKREGWQVDPKRVSASIRLKGLI
ncbi:hypothetical protein ACFFOV_00055 [Cerasicoccus arenae]|uniref:Transposase n=1 Tax=Cerasicoccus arenae TaxID=424488 RepID=A0A8J3DE60_9BACT|nr:hypothetical protein [Cerasicoccus arenae]MBK1859858.1 hypothetical protein [Cerasicoccus arenae]GHC13406.1 hypothetical protein GCM10007047_33450 [Cerasicoccus arenae]